MSYIPIVTPPPTPSARAQELSDALARLIEEFGQRFPDTSPTDIRQALQLARQKTAGSPAPTLALALVLGVVMLVLGVLFFLMRSSGGLSGTPWVLIALVGGIVAALGLLVVKARGDS